MATPTPEVLYAPILQGLEYEKIAYEYIPNANVNAQRIIYYAHVLYYMAFIPLAIAHGVRFVTALLAPMRAEAGGGGEEAGGVGGAKVAGKSPFALRRLPWTVAGIAQLSGDVIENVAYMGPAGLAVVFFALFYVDQGTTRLASLEWATLGGLFFVASPSGYVLRGSPHIMFNAFIGLLLWQMGEDSVRLAFLHKMAAILYGIGATHVKLEHKAKAIGYAALFTADVLLIVAQGETQQVPLPSYFRPWNTSYDPMWAPLIAMWTVTLLSLVPTAVQATRDTLAWAGATGRVILGGFGSAAKGTYHRVAANPLVGGDY